MHVGLSMFVYRILHKVWEMSLLQVAGSGGKANGRAVAAGSGVAAVELSLPADTIAALEAIMRGLVAVVNHVLERLQVRFVTLFG
jgi:gamma-glutamylcysteine synthetase